MEHNKPGQTDWEAKAASFLKEEWKREGVTYAQLAEKLSGLDIHETERNLINNISRGIQCCVLVTMSRGYWIAAIALGLSSASVNLAFSQSPEEPANNQSQSDGKDNAGDEPAPPFGLPIRILENPEESESAKQQQQEAEQREIEGLSAQKSMADSTEKIVYLTALQIVLATIGTIALVYSIFLNRKATEAAIAAVGAERAWMTFARFDCGPIPSNHTNDTSAGIDSFGYFIVWANNGRSPAIKVTCQNTFILLPFGEDIPIFPVLTPDGFPNMPVGPGDSLQSELVPLKVEQAQRYLTGQARLLIYSRLEYFDGYSNVKRVSEICSEVISTPQVDQTDGVVSGAFMLKPVGDQSSVS